MHDPAAPRLAFRPMASTTRAACAAKESTTSAISARNRTPEFRRPFHRPQMQYSSRRASAAWFRSSVTSIYKFYFTDCKNEAWVLHTFFRQFEHATTTDEVTL
jgi:hypothetical protein